MFILTLETNKDTSNFEREMFAYMTGQVAECGVGSKQADLAKQHDPELVERMEEIVYENQDNDGCYRPVISIGKSLEMYFDEQPTNEDMIRMLNRAQVYNPDIKILTNKFEEEITTRVLLSYKTGSKVAYNIQLGDK